MICIVIILFLSLLLKKTKMGKAIRMMAENQDLAKIIGIDVSSLHSITFSLGVSLAAVAGCMLSSVFPLYPAVGWENLTLALAVGMLAGMGSIEGTIVAGVIYGIVDSFTGFYISSQFRSLSIFILIFVILVLRPYGLMGKAGYEQMD
jgi:branched-chain amino acid transport system permease protein